MALTKNVVGQAFGKEIPIANAYIKVQTVNGTKELVHASVVTYTENKADTVKVETFMFVPDMFGGNFIRQAYDHLKTLPEFENAQDC